MRWLLASASLLILSSCSSADHTFAGSAVSLPLPAGGTLNAVSCPSANLCFAAMTVAAAPGTVGPSLGRLMRWDGKRWGLVPIGLAAVSENLGSLDGISCSSATFCMTVGSSESKAFAEIWDGRRWRALLVPAPPVRHRLPGQRPFQAIPYLVVLSAVTCPAPTACFAVGAVRYPTVDTPNADMFAEQWDGRSWRVMPLPPGDGTQELSAIACLRVDDCVAVGATLAGVGGLAPVPLVERWNGQTWQATPVPIRGGPSGSGRLQGIACPTPAWCLAVGQGPSGANAATPSLAVTFEHSTWAETATPPGEGLSGVTCLRPRDCVVAGSAWDNTAGYAGNEVPLLAEYNGKWTDLTLGGVRYGPLGAVACPTRHICVAGGLSLVTTLAGV